MTTTDYLVDALQREDVLPSAWRPAFLAVARHRFLPDHFWVDDE